MAEVKGVRSDESSEREGTRRGPRGRHAAHAPRAGSGRGPGRPPQGARDAIVAAATELFREHDFADVSTEEILRRAGVSRGALYHHFPSKKELFRVVFEASEARVIERIAVAAARADGPFEQLVAGSRAYIREAATSGELQQIGLRQSRAVLGWEGWREAASRLGIGVVEAGVRAAMEAGEMKRGDVTAATHLILGAMIEGAMLVSTAPNPTAVRRRVEPVMIELLGGLRA